LPFETRLAAAGNIQLFVKDLDSQDRVNGYSIYLATLQRMVICKLRRQLADVVQSLEYDRVADDLRMDRAKKLLTQYCDAVRDYDFMAERLVKANDEGEDDPFKISTRSLLDLCLMRDAALVPMKGEDDLSWQSLYHRVDEDRERYRELENVLPCESRSSRWNMIERNLILERLAMGLAGGAALIVPMVIMVLHNDLLTTLLTTGVATMVFAGVLALFGKNLKGETVLGSVAAYTAVLVVFVGTSN
jgi:hypothetical protein